MEEITVSNKKTFPVDLGTKHIIYEVSKTVYIWWIVLRGVVHLAFGIYLFLILYKECLFNEHCNPIAVGYLAILSLLCFAQVGLPIEKMANFVTK